MFVVLMASNRVLLCGVLVLALAEAVYIDSHLRWLNFLIDGTEPGRLGRTRIVPPRCEAGTIRPMHCFNANLLSHALDSLPPPLTRLPPSSLSLISVSVPVHCAVYPFEPNILALPPCRLRLRMGPAPTLPST